MTLSPEEVQTKRKTLLASFIISTEDEIDRWLIASNPKEITVPLYAIRSLEEASKDWSVSLKYSVMKEVKERYRKAGWDIADSGSSWTFTPSPAPAPIPVPAHFDKDKEHPYFRYEDCCLHGGTCVCTKEKGAL